MFGEFADSKNVRIKMPGSLFGEIFRRIFFAGGLFGELLEGSECPDPHAGL